jgi:hypothetical protein
MPEFFVQLLKRVAEKENVFTECLAAALRHDSELARDFLVVLCGPELDGVDVRAATVEVDPQKAFLRTADHPACCVDLVFTLNRVVTVGVENKLWAVEGKTQLSDYLKLGLNRIAYVTARDRAVEPDVRANPQYLKPTRGHFLWSDFDEVVERRGRHTAGPLLTKALLEAFRHFGFEPPTPEIGNLLDADEDIRTRTRKNFAKLWETTRTELQKIGWNHLTPGSIAELYVQDGPSDRIKRVWLDPTWGRGLLRVRLTPHAGKVGEVEEALRFAQLPHGRDVHVHQGQEPRRRRDAGYVEATISLRTLLGGALETEAMKKSLAEFVTAVFRAVG